MDRPLDERTVLQMQLSSGLLYAGRQWQRLADSRLGSYGISTACTMPLLMIGRSGGGIRQVALAQQLGMEGPSLVRLLDKLCASDLVRRESDASDRRANLLWLTDAGHALVSELEDQLIGLRQDVFGELSMDELHAVLKAWRLLAEAADRIVELVSHEFPQAKLMVRSFDREHSLRLIHAGVDFQIRETFESAVLFGQAALVELGADEDDAVEIAEQIRRRDAERFELEIAGGGLNAGAKMVFGNSAQGVPTPTPFTAPKRASKTLNPQDVPEEEE